MEGILIEAELDHREMSSKQNQSEYSECIQSTIVWLKNANYNMQNANGKLPNNGNCRKNTIV